MDRTESTVRKMLTATVAYAKFVGTALSSPGRLGHAPFLEAPGDFNSVLERCLQDGETGRAASSSVGSPP